MDRFIRLFAALLFVSGSWGCSGGDSGGTGYDAPASVYNATFAISVESGRGAFCSGGSYDIVFAASPSLTWNRVGQVGDCQNLSDSGNYTYQAEGSQGYVFTTIHGQSVKLDFIYTSTNSGNFQACEQPCDPQVALVQQGTFTQH